MPDIEQVPVERLIANTQQRLAALDQTTNSAEAGRLKAQLARIHALAYAQNKQQLAASRPSGELYEGPGWVPAIPLSPWEKDSGRGTTSHLALALALYKEVLDARPEDSGLRIGYAWCLEENGDRDRAIEHYRAVVAAAWPQDRQVDSLEWGALALTQEAAQRLIPLLDPVTDAAEIADLKRRDRHFEDVRRWITPIFVPLDDALTPEKLFDLGAAVTFDLDGSGIARDWRWLTPQAAWLVWDPTGRGEITSGLQLFGSVTFWLFWENGYDALTALDDDGNGRLTGAELVGLALWRDGDGDGLSAPGEVRSVTDWGIVGLEVSHQRHPAGFPYNPRGVRLSDGRWRASYDWFVPTAPRPAERSYSASRSMW